ncbi:hypothetical protein JMJ35_010644 [Cladonia borealis]|uniref:Alpha/beta hydrolase fold-3 domain-containing protein n=1 Tax=Cladonia borealis TaxID=184061 RepID=A0AA39QSA2_9LECA|nr:hypothetical protein JMJ35_010644 [Cladonia borealis]
MSEVARDPKQTIHEDYGTLFATDYVLLMCYIVWIIFLELPWFLLSRLSLPSHFSEPSFGVSLKNFLIRTTNKLFNYRQIRLLIRPSASDILKSPRYGPFRQNLYHRICFHSFTGYWIIQSSFNDTQPPRHSDVTIFFLHGGGYFASQPDTYLLFLLRLAEAITTQGIKVSIFALDYHLAPEFQYPTQLDEAKAAYDYLLRDMAIPADRVVVAGDSAGGHLVLSLLVDLHQRSSRPKPGGAMLFSPWVSLHHTPSTNAYTDVISAAFLRATARRFLGPARSDRKETRTDPLLEFLNPHPEIEWDAVLPSWLWVSAGTNEIMFDDIVKLTQALEKRLGRQRVDWEWGEGEVHDWQWLETMDYGAKKRFLAKHEHRSVNPPSVSPGATKRETLARPRVRRQHCHRHHRHPALAAIEITSGAKP